MSKQKKKLLIGGWNPFKVKLLLSNSEGKIKASLQYIVFIFAVLVVF